MSRRTINQEDRQVDRRVDRQVDRQVDRRVDRQVDRRGRQRQVGSPHRSLFALKPQEHKGGVKKVKRENLINVI